eukprot:SM000083S22782  [mRNA]  locus=s83:402541:403618:+ [translate_table: standard]
MSEERHLLFVLEFLRTYGPLLDSYPLPCIEENEAGALHAACREEDAFRVWDSVEGAQDSIQDKYLGTSQAAMDRTSCDDGDHPGRKPDSI